MVRGKPRKRYAAAAPESIENVGPRPKSAEKTYNTDRNVRPARTFMEMRTDAAMDIAMERPGIRVRPTCVDRPLSDRAVPSFEGQPKARPRPVSPAAFDAVFEAHKADVYRVACALTGNARDAEDLFQETWLRAVKAGRGPERLQDFRPWLLTIAANVHRDGLRKARVRRVFFLERATAMAEARDDADTGWDSGRDAGRDQAARTEFEICLARAVSKLPPKQRRVFVLKDVEGFRHDEIGRMLGIPERTVRTLLHRAVKRLQKELAPFSPAGPERPGAEGTGEEAS
jgi:RNA polymerase sigma-70 factor (ECF subfamily)